jgi:sugar O-acyltransferase (sialic acid O-acetyltransferase NeuD family)
MAREIIVYGARMLATMLYFDARDHEEYVIKAFVVDEAYLEGTGMFLGLPQVSFEEALARYSPAEFDMLVLNASFIDMRGRDDLYQKAKVAGYRLVNYISPRSVISPDSTMGDNNVVFEHTYLGPGGSMGSNNILRQQVYIGHEYKIGNGNVITPGVKIGGGSTLGNNCYIGLGATIINGLRIEEESLVGAGSLVIKDTEPFSKSIGSPSRIIGYHEEDGLKVQV